MKYYRTVHGCLKRIKIIKERVDYYKKARGVGPGTFYLDLKAVDAAIQEGLNEIKLLEKRIELLNSEQEDERSVATKMPKEHNDDK